MKNRLNINNNFATAAPWSHDLRVPVRAAAPEFYDTLAPLDHPLRTLWRHLTDDSARWTYACTC